MKKKTLLITLSIVLLIIVGYNILDNILFDGVRPVKVENENFEGKFYAKKEVKNATAIIAIGGGDWGDFWAHEVAKKDYVGVSIPYLGVKGNPKSIEEYPLEYFENVLNWLSKNEQVNPKKIIVIGASRNAELAMILASTFHDKIHGVIAYSPSCYAWSNTVLPYNSDTLKSSWTYKGLPIGYQPVPKFKSTVDLSHDLDLLSYWNSGLSDSVNYENAVIKVENIRGPILMVSGKEDLVWPSAEMADRIEKRLKDKGFGHEVLNLQYENAGHLISGNPFEKSEQYQGEMVIDGVTYFFDHGGTTEGDYLAKQTAYREVFEFLDID